MATTSYVPWKRLHSASTSEVLPEPTGPPMPTRNGPWGIAGHGEAPAEEQRREAGAEGETERSIDLSIETGERLLRPDAPPGRCVSGNASRQEHDRERRPGEPHDRQRDRQPSQPAGDERPDRRSPAGRRHDEAGRWRRHLADAGGADHGARPARAPRPPASSSRAPQEACSAAMAATIVLSSIANACVMCGTASSFASRGASMRCRSGRRSRRRRRAKRAPRRPPARADRRQRLHDDALRIGLADDAQADRGRGQVRNLRRQEGIESGARSRWCAPAAGPTATG